MAGAVSATTPRFIRRLTMTIEIDREIDGRWIAEVTALPGVLAYGTTREEALRNVELLAWRVVPASHFTVEGADA